MAFGSVSTNIYRMRINCFRLISSYFLTEEYLVKPRSKYILENRYLVEVLSFDSLEFLSFETCSMRCTREKIAVPQYKAYIYIYIHI